MSIQEEIHQFEREKKIENVGFDVISNLLPQELAPQHLQ
jgi:hypothetical protein